MFIVGLTGGIGSGKSTVSHLFKDLGAPVVDTDELAHQLVAPGQPALSQIVATFGKQVLDGKGQLDRAKLRDIVFNKREKRERLEAILHPLIQSAALEKIKQLDDSYCVLVVPLLVEKQWQHLVNRVLVIDCPEELQKQRVKLRSSLSERQIDAILNSQATRQQRLALADDVICNDETIEKLIDNVTKLHQKYLKLAQSEQNSEETLNSSQ